MITLYEQRLKDGTSASELAEAKHLVSELTNSVKLAQSREEALKAEVARQKTALLEADDLAKGFSEKISVMGDEIGGLKADKHTASNQVARLNQKIKDLSARLLEMSKNHEADLKRSAQNAKLEMSSSYKKVLDSIKSKWEAKKMFLECESEAAEIESNLVLIEQITHETIDLNEEEPRLRAELARLSGRCKEVEVSDFSINKLELPQISEGSVAPMEVDLPGVPTGINEFGSNLEEARDNIRYEETMLRDSPGKEVGQ